MFYAQHLPNISTWLELCPNTNNHTHIHVPWILEEDCWPCGLLSVIVQRRVSLGVQWICPLTLLSELPIQVWGQIFGQKLLTALTTLASSLCLLLSLSPSFHLRLSVHRHVAPPTLNLSPCPCLSPYLHMWCPLSRFISCSISEP